MLITGLLAAIPWAALAQSDNWQNKDLLENGVPGTSTEKAYKQLIAGKRYQVIVAVIDSGIDTSHHDLKGHLWANPGEIPGNHLDDDHNGYTDDVHGWNFAGLPVSRDSLVFLAQHKKQFFDSLSYTTVPPELRLPYQQFRKIWKDYEDIREKLARSLDDVKSAQRIMDTLQEHIGSNNPTIAQLRQWRQKDSSDKWIIDAILAQLPAYPDFASFKTEAIDKARQSLAFCVGHLTTGSDSAGIVAGYLEQNANICYDRVFTFSATDDFYHSQPLTFHGTHIAGIIAANRENGDSVDGIADSVLIMPIKIYSALYPKMVDANLASAIRYAVDNGARVINLSLGLYGSPGKKDVDAAVKYAMQHNVLIVHAAGNDGKNLDQLGTQSFFPNKHYADGSGEAEAWLDVGASGWADDSTLAAPFSNYGRAAVDVFAPGVRIYSTIPGSKYEHFNGTSMATPVVAGLAALIMELFPHLTAAQVAAIIRQSVYKVSHPVIQPGSNAARITRPFADLCSSGGIVNTYNALLLAAKYQAHP